jgi:hypothetical protein
LEVTSGRLYVDEAGLARLSDAELHLLKFLVKKTLGHIPEDEDVLANIPHATPRPLGEIEPVEEEVEA